MLPTAISWTAVEAVGVWCNALFVVGTLWFIYRQVRTAAKSFELEAMERLQDLVDNFSAERRLVFETCPLSLAASADQFARTPPGRHRSPRLTAHDVTHQWFTPEQEKIIGALDPATRECAKKIIAKLNDIGQLVEDGYMEMTVVLGKYHVMIIQCCHMVEAIRRDEEKRRGGNYGQRLLRMRRWSVRYNDAHPKHRQKPIRIWNAEEHRHIYSSPSPTFMRRIEWALRRLRSHYS